MTYPSSKYKQLMVTLLLGAYLVGNFSVPIFEGIHFMMHLGDKVPIHSFQTHDKQHNHQVLTSLEELLATNTSTDIPIKQSTDNKFKKVVQQFEVHSFLLFSMLVEHSANFPTKLVAYPIPFLRLAIPPPKV